MCGQDIRLNGYTEEWELTNSGVNYRELIYMEEMHICIAEWLNKNFCILFTSSAVLDTEIQINCVFVISRFCCFPKKDDHCGDEISVVDIQIHIIWLDSWFLPNGTLIIDTKASFLYWKTELTPTCGYNQ